MTVFQILLRKGMYVHSVPPDTKVRQALERMISLDIGALLVTQGGRLLGIFSEKGFARGVMCGSSGCFLDRPVADVMEWSVFTINPKQTVLDAMTLMTEKRVRHLPVLDDKGHVIGVLSIGDVVNALLKEQAFLIQQLEAYIRGDS
ncbi:CBS domain-containing protein [Thermus thermamylovorans]|uniref:CBS domain-containing protein n=1 Tax=Thermus thermamylovorans TaxID=2509362 RepID=A0A4Q9B3R4_9DEIN|nr:CBS domain-containing protein [Thermus thermamylovorans]TBH20184.1 CBS domain-containing protein [Thermus thermamylovorans]